MTTYSGCKTQTSFDLMCHSSSAGAGVDVVPRILKDYCRHSDDKRAVNTSPLSSNNISEDNT